MRKIYVILAELCMKLTLLSGLTTTKTWKKHIIL